MDGIPLQNAHPRVFEALTSSGRADLASLSLIEDDVEDDAAAPPFAAPGCSCAAASAPSSSQSSHSSCSCACSRLGALWHRRDPVDREEVFDLIRHLNDPEHPLTLEQLNVACLDLVDVVDEPGRSTVDVRFTPTIPHCSMATLIGLSIRVKLLRALPPRFKVTVRITPGAHASEEAVNKQLDDKERVAAALENGHLLDVVNKCVRNTDRL